LTELAGPGVGEALQRARQTQGLALEDVAQLLKFAPRQLEALEEERFEALPGGTFARGMVRNYARLLKLDPAPLLERIADRFGPADSGQLAARYSQPVPFSDGGRRSTYVYLGLSLAVLALVGMVAYEWHRETARPPVAVSTPERNPPLAASQAPSVPPAAPPAMPLPSSPAMLAAAPPPAAPSKDVSSLSKSMSPAKEAAPARPGNRIVLVCEEEAWLEVRDADDRLLVASLTPAGTERVVHGKPPFSMVIGNAQNVRVRYNDRPVDLAPHTKVEVARFTLK
jgi:cytoskeleton protein RodZ